MDAVTLEENPTGFADGETVSEYAVTALNWAVGQGIIGGIGRDGSMYLDPQGSATRAQAAVMLQRFCEEVNK